MKDVGLDVHYYCLLANNRFLSMSNFSKCKNILIFNQIQVVLPKVIFFHNQFKNHNI
jgi:hypothetical protein